MRSIVEQELYEFVGKFLEFKLEIVKDNEINLPEDLKKALLPWAEQIKSEAQELIDLLKICRDRYGHLINESNQIIKDPLCEVCNRDN